MDLGKPMWSPGWAGFLVRMSLALYFLMAGYVTLQNMQPFINAVADIHFLPPRVAMLYGAVLPYLELVVGFLLLIGLWTNVAAIIASLMLVSFISVVGLFPYPSVPELFNKDIILLAASLSLLASGPGGVSVDGQKQG